jgi:gliding motility-associated lipoprotein GldH
MWLYLHLKLFCLKKLVFFVTVIVPLLGIQACSQNGVFEQTKTLPGHAWASSSRLTYTFNIQDTSSWYNLYIILTHTDAYHYNNIYVDVTTIAPGDTAVTAQRQFQLAKNNYGWLGTAMDDIIEHRILLTDKGPVKLKKGNHTIILQQTMREDPLAGMISAGVRAEKVIQ